MPVRSAPVIAALLLAGAIATPARAATGERDTEQAVSPGSPVHVGVSSALVLGGELAEVPLTLYGVGAEAGYRLREPGGTVFTPFLSGHLMRGQTPAGLLFTSANYAAGLDVGLPRGAFGVHFVGELGRAANSLQRATSDSEYEVSQMTGQALVAVSCRTSRWFAVRAGLGYRAVGQVGGAVFVLGASL